MSDSIAPVYPADTVRSLLETDHVSPATRAALEERLQFSETSWRPRFFSTEQLPLLRSICAALTGDDPLSAAVDVTRFIDKRLADGQGKGWRYQELPDDATRWRDGLDAVNAEAEIRYHQAFIDLSPDQRSALLSSIQTGDVEAPAWTHLPPAQWFTETLAEVTEAFYAHPLVQEEIGYVGMADLPNWNHLGRNNLDPREPQSITLRSRHDQT